MKDRLRTPAPGRSASAEESLRGYLAKLLENAKVTKYVKQRQPEVLEQFTAIVATTSLDQ